jgi:hypothetical protein
MRMGSAEATSLGDHTLFLGPACSKAVHVPVIGGEEPRILLRPTVMLASQDQVLKEIEPRQLHHVLREKRRRESHPENREMGIP